MFRILTNVAVTRSEKTIPPTRYRAPPPFTQGRLFVLQINVDVKDSETFISEIAKQKVDF